MSDCNRLDCSAPGFLLTSLDCSAPGFPLTSRASSVAPLLVTPDRDSAELPVLPVYTPLGRDARSGRAGPGLGEGLYPGSPKPIYQLSFPILQLSQRKRELESALHIILWQWDSQQLWCKHSLPHWNCLQLSPRGAE